MNRALRRCATGSLLPLLLVLSACSSSPIPDDRYYQTRVEAPAAHAPLPLRLVVEPFEVHGLYGGRPLVYLDRSGAYRQSHRNNWIESPALMLAAGLLDYLRAAYGAEAAFLPQARVGADLIVRARVVHFERIPDATPAQARLALEMIVATRRGKLIRSLEFDESAAAGTSIPDYVRTQSELLGKAWAQLLTVLDDTALMQTPSP